MASISAPAHGGASTSTPSTSTSTSTSTRRSAWDPYQPLPPSTKRKLDPRDTLPTQPYLDALSIPSSVAEERLAGKLIQLDPPEGKVSDQRKAELAVREREKDKKRRSRDCGLVGKRKRAKAGGTAVDSVNYQSVLPVHHLWLGYMAELLGLPLSVPPLTSVNEQPSRHEPNDRPLAQSSIPLPTFPSKTEPLPPNAQGLNLNVVNIQTKLVKAEFVGCILSVKRAKNPSLVGLEGIVLQETQGSFKIVTSKSTIKILPKQNSVFTFTLPLEPSPTAPKRELKLDIFGDSFAYRSAERVGRKWKAGSSAGGVELV